MRADRLLSLLMLLQSRGRLTARELADALEVSKRTIYRDVDALSAAGVPIFADRGPEGGFSLLDSYRTDLTGLTDGELRALFLLSIPSPVADLGLDGSMAAALRKLCAAVPGPRRGEELRVRQRFYLDPSPWSHSASDQPHLRELQQAAWDDRRADIAYRLPSGPIAQQRIDVYGLVAKEGIWHVVHKRDGRVQAFRVSELIEVRLTEERFARSRDFDLPAAWEEWCAGVTAQPGYEFCLLVDPRLACRLSQYGIDSSLCEEIPPDEEGRARVKARCDSFVAARDRLLALGCAVEVVSPEPLRWTVIDYAGQITRRYKDAML